MPNEFVTMIPLVSAYLSEAVKNLEREGRRPPAAEVGGLVWMVACILKAGVDLPGIGLFQCELSEIESMMRDRARFRDSTFALALREAVGLVLRDLSRSPSGRAASVRAANGIDLDRLPMSKPTQPRLALRPARSMIRLLLYELLNAEMDPDGPGAPDSQRALIRFLRRTYLDLPRTDRRILGLRAILGMSWDDIVKETGVPRTSAHRRFQATLKSMADALDGWVGRTGYGSYPRP